MASRGNSVGQQKRPSPYPAADEARIVEAQAVSVPPGMPGDSATTLATTFVVATPPGAETPPRAGARSEVGP